jgi:hypothetical protein
MKGYRGAKKKPTRLAKRIGVKVLNPVNLASSRVVLIGVLVTVEFRAAITQIIAKVSLDAGLMIAIAFPKQAPIKNSGMIIPPRQPPFTVVLMANTLAITNPEDKRDNRKLAKVRIKVEHIIRCLKIFRILSSRYRNRRKGFGLRVNLIAAIYNCELKLAK